LRPPEHFRVSNKRGYLTFPAMGRTYFRNLEEEVDMFIQSYECSNKEEVLFVLPTTRKCMVYGNTGGGKSHLLMLLALRLRQRFFLNDFSYRVIIIPDAAELVGYDGFSYMIAALQLAFADDIDMLTQLSRYNRWEDLNKFYAKRGKLLFIVDQANAFENAGSRLLSH